MRAYSAETHREETGFIKIYNQYQDNLFVQLRNFPFKNARSCDVIIGSANLSTEKLHASASASIGTILKSEILKNEFLNTWSN